jgi:DNA (cytosine-5)-methyltransferase 3A
MNIISLFDGISCARVALNRAGIKYDKYYASEIDKYAIQIAKKNYPDTIHIGDVQEIKGSGFNNVWLLIGGSPCQDLSIAKRGREGLQGKRSRLFWEYVRILNDIKPQYFILENVASMSKNDKQVITETLFGIEPVMIDASLVSAQMRKRLFWVGKLKEDGTYKKVDIPLPEDRGILLKDILLSDGIAERDKSLCVTATYHKACPQDYFNGNNRQLIRVGYFNKDGQADKVYSIEGKSVTLLANGGGRGANTGLYETDRGVYRKLHPVECERLQGLPDNYTEGISNTQRYKCLGNAFNVDVIVHILKNLKI